MLVMALLEYIFIYMFFFFHWQTLINHLTATRFSLPPEMARGNKTKETRGKCESLTCSLLPLVLSASQAFLTVETDPGFEVLRVFRVGGKQSG